MGIVICDICGDCSGSSPIKSRAYLRLVVREASKFGGDGWLTYDTMFRRNQKGSSAPWKTLDAALKQVYIAGNASKIVTPCRHCHEVDHQSADCAVAAILPKSHPIAPVHASPADLSAGASGKRPVCFSWNTGSCKYPGKCSFAHVFPPLPPPCETGLNRAPSSRRDIWTCGST